MGIVGAGTLFGILVGTSSLGGLAVRFGRRTIFIVEMALFCVFLDLLTVSPGFLWLVICLVGTGIALDGDYPTAHLIISESVPSRTRGKLVLSAFGFPALGALTGTLIRCVVLSNDHALDAWRWMYASALAPAVLVLIAHFTVTESAPWLLSQGRTKDAERATLQLLDRIAAYPTQDALANAGLDQQLREHHDQSRFADLFNKRHHRATVPAAVLLADRLGRVRRQVVWFIGCAAGLLITSLALNFGDPTATILIFVGFMLFNFMINIAPNAQTYLLAGEVFPTAVCRRDAGFAASFAKVGAITTVFLFPILLHEIGEQILLCMLVGTSLLGAAVTWLACIETKDVDLDKL